MTYAFELVAFIAVLWFCLRELAKLTRKRMLRLEQSLHSKGRQTDALENKQDR